jgi:hypothetical protein
MTRKRQGLPGKCLNDNVQGPNGEPVVLIDALEVRSGQQLRITFENVASTWRQGMFLATEGMLVISGTSLPKFVLWQDSAPEVVTIDVVDTSGTLILYNVWDSGRNLGKFESQSATSGMIVKELPQASRRYWCNDIGSTPEFNKLVVRVDLVK